MGQLSAVALVEEVEEKEVDKKTEFGTLLQNNRG